MRGFLTKRKSGPDFTGLETNRINISGVQFQFSVPGNGSRNWGTRGEIPKAINLYSDIYKLNTSGFYSHNITVQIWDYVKSFWLRQGGHWGDLHARWEIACLPHNKEKSIGNLTSLQKYLEEFYRVYYENPDGQNVQARKRNPGWTDEDLRDQIIHLPTDYKTININGRDWLSYSVWSETPGRTSWYYTLPITEQHFIFLKFTFVITDDHDSQIEKQQKEAAQKIASYMKVTFPDEEVNN